MEIAGNRLEIGSPDGEFDDVARAYEARISATIDTTPEAVVWC